MWGQIAGAAASLIGSVLGSKKASDSAAEQAMMNYAMQKEFAQNGIRWRVADAKAAGLHPLYALGGSGASFSPNPITVNDGGFGAAGQHLGRAIQATATTDEKALIAQQLEESKARTAKEYSQAAYFDSMAGRAAQAQQPSFPSMGSDDPIFDVVRQHSPTVSYPYRQADPIIDPQVRELPPAGPEEYFRPSVVAAKAPMWKEFVIDDPGTGKQVFIQLPDGGSASESLEAVSESRALMGLVVLRNMQQYGPEWANYFRQWFGPVDAYGPDFLPPRR